MHGLLEHMVNMIMFTMVISFVDKNTFLHKYFLQNSSIEKVYLCT